MTARRYKAAVRYALYDAGNSNYATLVPSVAFPIYFKTTVAAGLSAVDAVWGGVIVASTVLAAILGPRIGEIADRRGSRLLLLRWTSWFAVVGTISLSLLGKDQLAPAVLLFISTNTAFLLAVFLYDATLADVSSRKNSGMVSSLAWATGYAGGLIGLFIALATSGPESARLRWILAISGFLFLALSFPLLLTKTGSESGDANTRAGEGRKSLIALLRSFAQDSKRSRFFWSYFMYSNGVSAIIYFTSIYATTTLGYSLDQLLWLFVAMSVVAVPSVILFGRIAAKSGHVKTLRLVVASWFLIVLAVGFADAKTFAVIACIAAAFLGPVQALSRSLFRVIFPEHSMSSFFGVQSLAARGSALVGPVVFGLISSLTGSQRLGVFAMAFLFVGGLALLMRLPALDSHLVGEHHASAQG